MDWLSSFLDNKRWHVIVSILFPVLFTGVDAFYTMATSGQIVINHTGITGALVTGAGLFLAAAASHKDDKRVNGAGLALPATPPVSTDLAARIAEMRSVATELQQLHDALAIAPGGQQVVASIPPEVVALIQDVRDVLQQLPQPMIAAPAGG